MLCPARRSIKFVLDGFPTIVVTVIRYYVENFEVRLWNQGEYKTAKFVNFFCFGLVGGERDFIGHLEESRQRGNCLTHIL